MLKILSAAALLVVVVAGCGGAAQPRRPAFHGVPRALAQDWEGRASAIATAASAGNGCRALRLAESLRIDVIAEEHRLPLRLRAPLLTGVNALADRISCVPPVTSGPPKPPKPPHEHGHRGHHDRHGHHGDGGGNGQ